MNDFSRGSEWRKWDLHIHTPSSEDYEDKSVTDEQFIEKLINNNINVIVITDHNIIDIDRIKKLKKTAKSKITILPGIELCTDSRGKEPIHIIGIFPEDSDIDYIWNEISVKSEIASQKQKGRNNNEIYCDLSKTCDLIHKLGGLVSIHAGKKSNSIENLTNTLPPSMAEKKDISEKIDIFELGKVTDLDEYKKIVLPKIGNYPLIICSDNHNINKYSLKENLWLKSDPTFEGLKQIIYEPEERIFIGEEPKIKKRVRENKTKFIKELFVNQISGYKENKGSWFKNITIPFNSGLVAIIGNKGNGKSAIADILGLCGNSYRYNDFSFLKDERFLKDGLAKNFEAELLWESNEKTVNNLNDQIKKNAPERVKYLPQNFFERLTNDLDAYGFEETLENLVFSYLPEDKTFGKDTLKELIDYTNIDIRNQLDKTKIEIEKLNKKIIELEKKKHPDYLIKLEELLKIKEKELKEHEKIKPQSIDNPSKDENYNEKTKNINKELKNLNKAFDILQKEIKEKQDEKNTISKDIQELQNIKSELVNFNNQINDYIEQNSERFLLYELDISDILNIKINFNILEEKIKIKNEYLSKLNDLLLIKKDKKINKKNNVNLIMKKNEIIIQIDKFKKNLSEPQLEYQKYLENLKEWEEQKKEIEGSEKKSNTLKWIKQEIKYIKETLIDELDVLQNKRLKFVEKIYKTKSKIIEIYKNLKSSIDEEIKKFQDILDDYQITVDVSFRIHPDFFNAFFKYVNQKVKGSFYGIDEGKIILEKIITNKDINSYNGIESLLKDIQNSLEEDKRENIYDSDKSRNIKDQILKEHEWPLFYNYIFFLDYLEPIYELKLGDKKIAQLSPGEKGALLVVFYLLLDKDDIPLIIDQPEENLDNESIFKILTLFIRYVKKKRQIIIVTHNPNLAIVGDAEQIIFVKIDKKNNNAFSFESGGIENSKINKHASDILEGTLKAFNVRRLKYLRNFNSE